MRRLSDFFPLMLAAIFVLSGCRAPSPATYRYEAHITTGNGHTIWSGGREHAVCFSDDSDLMARGSLCHLRSEVLHAAGNEITIHGTIQKQAAKPLFHRKSGRTDGQKFDFADPVPCLLFNLRDWKLKTPFYEQGYDIEKAFPLKVRHALSRSDFSRGTDFDPRDPRFDPARHQQKN